MSTTRAVWVFLFVLTALRLALVGTTDLAFDEAHYWMWSQRLGPAYFSKGPGVAFAIWSSTAIFGAGEFGVRFWSPVLGAGTSLLLYYFARRLYSETTGFWLVLGLNVTPIFNIGSFVMTTDPLSIFFWVAAMFTFWLALERSPAFSWYWPLSGLMIGIGFLCKYTNALQLVSVAAVLLLVPRFRREFLRPGLYALLGVFLISMIPPIVWNAQHAWPTITHLIKRGDLDHAPSLHPLEVLAFLAMHLAVYSPLLWFGLAWAVIASWKRAHQQFKGIFLLWMGVPVFAVYFIISLNHAANANWDGLAFLSLGVLAASYWRERLESRPQLRRWAAAAFLLGLFMSVIALDSDLLRTAGFELPRRDPADRMRSWKSASEAVEKMRGEIEQELGQKVFVIADERDRASEFAYYFHTERIEGPGHPPVYIVESQDIVNQFSFWPRYDEFVEAPNRPANQEGDVYTEEGGVNLFQGRTAIFVQANKKPDAPHNIQAAFESVEPLRIIEIRRYGKMVRRLEVFLCKNYRPLSL
ncbi:MAG TPA: glycosyltransferase family 39 protein [Chthoniobacterales bacterium]|nr:glycosyltransferase family 39 protein [Chthoniobacterales bacterium]